MVDGARAGRDPVGGFTAAEDGLIQQSSNIQAPRPIPRSLRTATRRGVFLFLGDALEMYEHWPVPVVIVSDGAYGVSGFPGDTPTSDGLIDWYRPHVRAWSEAATGETTLWFWNTEIGWATVHPLLREFGWEYVGCNVWDKGIAHVSGNTNSKTLRRFPVATEVCVQYVRPPRFVISGREVEMKEWLRWEWMRAGFPLNRSNEVCGVRNAATRKYLTQDHVWYFPPPDAFQRLADYANTHGHLDGRPYFSLDGKAPLTAREWARMRSKFDLELGVTNVWSEPAMRGKERVRRTDGSGKFIHANQKPARLIRRIIEATSSAGDVVWEPFGGLCTAAVVSADLGRRCFSAELLPEYFSAAVHRLKNADQLRLI
jgi:site-specific DNA-methyltransferase (adenine-specific)